MFGSFLSMSTLVNLPLTCKSWPTVGSFLSLPFCLCLFCLRQDYLTYLWLVEVGPRLAQPGPRVWNHLLKNTEPPDPRLQVFAFQSILGVVSHLYVLPVLLAVLGRVVLELDLVPVQLASSGVVLHVVVLWKLQLDTVQKHLLGERRVKEKSLGWVSGAHKMARFDLEVLVAGQVDLDGQVLIFLELARDLALQGGVQHARCVCRARKKGEQEYEMT